MSISLPRREIVSILQYLYQIRGSIHGLYRVFQYIIKIDTDRNYEITLYLLKFDYKI